ncbi:uncharacterized protein V6R79_021343 [Siganus canaliculatus]
MEARNRPQQEVVLPRQRRFNYTVSRHGHRFEFNQTDMNHWLRNILILTLWTGCKGQDEVTQTGGDVTATEGDSVTLNCSYKISVGTPYLFCLIYDVALMPSFSPLCPGLTAGDNINPVKVRVSGREGQSVTLSCQYQTGDSRPWLYWYRQNSDLKAPQFILWKGAKDSTSENIPAGRYGSTTSDTSTDLTIRDLTLADTALYYCALQTQ